MTKGKIVLELLEYAKSEVRKIDQSEASIGSHMTTTVLSTAFQNGMTLENWPKNEGMRANFLFWGYFYQNLKNQKTLAGGPWNLFWVIQMVPMDIPKGP